MLLLAAPLLVLAPRIAPQAAADPAKDLGSNDPAVRLAAVKLVAEKGHPEAEKLLLGRLDDDDWEVASIAAAELGELGAKKALGPLLDLALEGPVRGLRRVAGEALARVDAEAAYEKLAKELGGDEAVRACAALAALGPALEKSEGKRKTKELDKLLGGRDAPARRAAARALLALAGEGRVARLKDFLADEDPALRAEAIEAAGVSSDARVFELLARQFEATDLAGFLARRIHAALRAILLANPDRRAELVGVLTGLKGGNATSALVARALGIAGEARAEQRALEPAEALAALKPYLAASFAPARAAAATACGRIAGDEALDAAAALAADPDAHVRRIALGVVARARGAKHEGTRALLLAALAKDSDARVRETAASYLGVRNTPEVIPVLEAALSDSDWRVMTSAAVALGKTENEASAAALIELHRRGEEDWKKRASAMAGLARLRARPAVPILIAALEDEEALVVRTAHEFLREVSHQTYAADPGPWTKWWEENQDKIKLSIPEEVLERRKKLGYAKTQQELFSGTYVGIDVLVLQSRGDHIENVLDGIKIEHRRTSSGQVIADGLHPQGVFVSNCTGEITADERERLSWFVRAGGALFGSCWALSETIQDIEPGLVKKLETRGEVLGDFPAYPVDGESRFLQGVFNPDARPIYHLEGAHLIEVLDPEEVEVLVDSPPCAARFGGADMAAWFRLGHGVVLDSANHFEGQGFKTASLRDPEERMAYAIDHLNLSYADLRAARGEKYWGKTSSADEHVKDLSVFRLITNFVWLKRLAEE